MCLVTSRHPKETILPGELSVSLGLTPDVTTVGGLHRELVRELSLHEGDGHLLLLWKGYSVKKGAAAVGKHQSAMWQMLTSDDDPGSLDKCVEHGDVVYVQHVLPPQGE